MGFNFLPQQQLAIEYPGNVAVSAGAGSGKTRVLVEKYFRLLVDEHPTWPIDSVVAITFTVKAAGELRQRIIKRVREELSDSEIPPARRARLQELRREIAGAPIGTIHNFCSRILREFAFDAKLNPDFAIVEGAHESSLRRDAVQQAMAQAAGAPGTQLYRDLLTLQAVYSRRQLASILESMLGRRAEFQPACQRYASEAEDEIFAEMQGLCDESAGSVRAETIRQLQMCLAALKTCAPAGPGELIGGLADRMDDLVATRAPWSEIAQLATDAYSTFFTEKGTLRKALEKALSITAQDPQVVALLQCCLACSNAAHAELTIDDRYNVSLTAMLARLFLDASELYGASRSAATSADEVDLLDFTDLELLAQKLITTSASVRKRLRERVRYLIVDEFQDTSEIQWEILGPIVCDDSGEMLPSRFFMVGDQKQGVYGFRQASSILFARVRESVTTSNESGCRGNVSIAYNFRTLEKPLRAVNELFETLMDKSVSVHEVEFEALEPQRAGSPGKSVLLLNSAVTADEENAPTEADVVAEEIARLLDDPQSTGEIAILLRKRKHFEDYERALRERGISFVTHRGKGLYEQPEILDLVAILRLLSNPHNDLVAAEVARGPLFSFPDDLLLKLSLMPQKSFWEKCCCAGDAGAVQAGQQRVQFSDADLERVAQLCTVFSRLSHMLGWRRIDELIAAAVTLTGARAIFNTGARGTQALANVQRFTELTRQLDTTDLDEFLNYLDSESLDGGGQGEATVHVPGTRVKIMTIHAAKGLEFETVFLPQLAEPITVRREDVLTDGNRWLAVQKTLSSETPRLFLSTYLGNIKKERAMSEEKRVLYVAMTRCRDALYLSATPGGSRQKDSFYGWMLPHLHKLPIETRSGSPTIGGNSSCLSRESINRVALHDGQFEQTRENCRGALQLRAGAPVDSHGGTQSHPFAPVLRLGKLSVPPKVAAPEKTTTDLFPDLLEFNRG